MLFIGLIIVALIVVGILNSVHKDIKKNQEISELKKINKNMEDGRE